MNSLGLERGIREGRVKGSIEVQPPVKVRSSLVGSYIKYLAMTMNGIIAGFKGRSYKGFLLPQIPRY